MVKCIFCGKTSDKTGLNADVCSECRKEIFRGDLNVPLDHWAIIYKLAKRVTELERLVGEQR